MSNQLPPAVLTRLRKDEIELSKQLSDGSLPEAVQTTKQTAERRLLSITTKAVDTLEEVMDSGAPKERVTAAVAVLDHSPATKPQVAGTTTDQVIPVEALKGLFTGLGKMFGEVLSVQQSQIARAEPIAEPISEPKLAPKRGRHAKGN